MTGRDDGFTPLRETHALPLSAALSVVVATSFFASLDSIMKYMAQFYPIFMLVFFRWSVQAVAIVVWLGRDGPLRLVRTRRPGMHVLRGAMMAASSFCFIAALRHLPLADITALNYSTPVVVSLLAVAFLNERLTAARVAFVGVAIVGMLLIVRPGTTMFQSWTVLGLCAAGFNALYQILTRVLAAEDWRVSMFFPAFIAVLASSFTLPFVEWPEHIPGWHVALFVAGCLVGSYGHYLLLRAFQTGAASAVTPFTYLQLVWATIIGWFAFRTFPDGWTIFGMVIISGSGLLIMLYERRQAIAANRRPAAPAQPTTID